MEVKTDKTFEAEVALRNSAIEDHTLQFIRALDSADVFPGAGALIYFLEKPWKWAPEYAAWLASGKPMDYSEDGWDEFVAAVEK